jgi:hypothetical protein
VRSLCLLVLISLPLCAQTAAPPPQPGQLATVSGPPLTNREKFSIRVIRNFGARGLIGNGVGAAIGQAMNTPSEWGQGTQGYATRYASGIGGTLTRQTIAFSIEALDHEDPRYFASQDKRTKQRLLTALAQVFWSHRDDGSQGFAYGRVVSAFASGQVVNAWQPPSNNSPVDGFERALITLGVDAGVNVAQEFIPFLRPKGLRHRH